MKKLCTLFLLILLNFSLVAQTQKSDVVADVNGEKITTFDLNSYHAQKLFTPSYKKVTREGSLNELIERKLTIQKARQEKLDQDEMVKDKMNEVLFQAQLSKDVAAKLTDIKVSDAEVNDLYSKNPEYRTSQILYRLPVFPKPEDVQAGYTAILAAHKTLVDKPESWNDTVKKFSMALELPDNGDVGFQPYTALAPEYYAAIKGQKVGFLTKPFRTQYGYHVVKVTGIKDIKDIDRGLYKKIVYDIKRDVIINNYLESLKRGAKISINSKLIK